MRAPIISDTTRAIMPVFNPFGDEEEVSGWYTQVICPVNGPEILPFPARETKEETQADIEAFLTE